MEELLADTLLAISQTLHFLGKHREGNALILLSRLLRQRQIDSLSALDAWVQKEETGVPVPPLALTPDELAWLLCATFESIAPTAGYRARTRQDLPALSSAMLTRFSKELAARLAGLRTGEPSLVRPKEASDKTASERTPSEPVISHEAPEAREETPGGLPPQAGFTPLPSNIYRHAKGGLYCKMFSAGLISDRGVQTESVVYLSLAEGVFYVRPAHDFHASVLWSDGVMRPRFVPWTAGPSPASPRENGGEECDNENGPCACGAWHDAGR